MLLRAQNIVYRIVSFLSFSPVVFIWEDSRSSLRKNTLAVLWLDESYYVYVPLLDRRSENDLLFFEIELKNVHDSKEG